MSEMKPRDVVAIDGLAATGKTTIARLLAEKLNFCCLHTGLLYRAVAFLVKTTTTSPEDLAKVVDLLKKHKIEPLDGRMGVGVQIDGQIFSDELSSPEIGQLTSQLSAHAEVRNAIYNLQRDAFPDCNIVAEGRDMATMIFPESKVKFFITASPKIRAQRRFQELCEKSPQISASEAKLLEKELEIELAARDQRDSNRSVAPTRATADAIIVDNSIERLTEVVQKMYVSSAKLLRLD